MKRREFLASSLSGVSGLLLGCRREIVLQERTKTFDPYEMVPLGKTGIKVTRVGLGTGIRGLNRQSYHTRMGKEKFEALLHETYERGIRLYDGADTYGTLPYIGPTLKKMPRKDFAIVSKIWFGKGGIPEPERPDADVVVQRFLKELDTDYIDLVLLHCMTSPSWPTEMSRQMEILDKLKGKGIIRAHGISCHSLGALSACVNEPWVESVHVRFNPYGVKMDDQPEKVAPVVKQIHETGKAVIAIKVIGEGKFRDNSEQIDASVRYSLTSGSVSAMVVGFQDTNEMDDLAERVRKVRVNEYIQV